MSALQPAGTFFQDDHRSSFNLDTSGFTVRDIELGSSPYLSAPKNRRFPSPALSELSLHGHTIQAELELPNLELPLTSDKHSSSLKKRLRSFWERNWGLVFVFFAQFFGNLMAVTARLLEQDNPSRKGMHTFQVTQSSPIIILERA
jgi:hypothetical protein